MAGEGEAVMVTKRGRKVVFDLRRKPVAGSDSLKTWAAKL